MNEELSEKYKIVRENASGFFEEIRGLIKVWGREAVQFLNGMVTNDVAKLEDNQQMLAAFPNAQGRLLALVRVLRKGDEFLFETEAATRRKVFQNLFRFTFAGDFFAEDLSEKYAYFSIQNSKLKIKNPGGVEFQSRNGAGIFVPKEASENFKNDLINSGFIEITDELYEILRIENGWPLYGVDMDETTIVPELDLPDLISYNKGCYIGQEIIARIHFRGHVAKKLTGLVLADPDAQINPNDEIKSAEGKNAGRLTSVTFSPKLQTKIALAYVRYDFLAEGTELKIDDFAARVKNLPFVE
jgi:folate-binding protein YgfZ